MRRGPPAAAPQARPSARELLRHPMVLRVGAAGGGTIELTCLITDARSKRRTLQAEKLQAQLAREDGGAGGFSRAKALSIKSPTRCAARAGRCVGGALTLSQAAARRKRPDHRHEAEAAAEIAQEPRANHERRPRGRRHPRPGGGSSRPRRHRRVSKVAGACAGFLMTISPSLGARAPPRPSVVFAPRRRVREGERVWRWMCSYEMLGEAGFIRVRQRPGGWRRTRACCRRWPP